MLIVETLASDSFGRPRIDGVLGLGSGLGLSLAAVPGSVPAAGEPILAVTSAAAPAILTALVGALIGGLLLNIMPCVFPILSLKALSLVRAGGSEREAKREALAYGGGVILTCLALGGLLLALRAGGAAVGWAFQLQDPRFVLILFLLVTVSALNLAGLFRLPGLSVERSGGGVPGAFAAGALAAFVATPCTGPFMAAALGATLVLPPSGALLVFGGLGLGLALPFLVLGFVPALRRRLPKPGPWMVRLQRILSIPMFLTAIALGWVLSRQTGFDLALVLVAALVLAAALAWLGRTGAPAQRWAAAAVAALAVAAPLALLQSGADAARPATTSLGAEPFAEARLAQLRAERAPVFLYFTADWCITCKVNENGALASVRVAQAFAQRGVRVMQGDWTLGDPAIGRFLERHGRSGIPLYIYYAPGQEPRLLPQILTASMLAELAA